MAEQEFSESNNNLNPFGLGAVRLFHVIVGDTERNPTTQMLNPFTMLQTHNSHISPAQSFPLALLGPNRPGA